MNTRYKRIKGQKTSAKKAKTKGLGDVVLREIAFSVLLKVKIGKKEIK